jgi:hypothetical protein
MKIYTIVIRKREGDLMVYHLESDHYPKTSMIFHFFKIEFVEGQDKIDIFEIEDRLPKFMGMYHTYG